MSKNEIGVITPKFNDKDVQNLLKKLSSDIELVELLIEPEPDSEESDCTNIVAKKVQSEGGRIIYGWQIWKTKFLVEAEFHAVWEMPDGKTLKDLTPKSYGLTHILFLEDEDLVYTGQQIDNIRLNITNNPLVSHFIAACETVYRLYNVGDRANHYDLTNLLTDEEKEELREIESIRDYLGAMLELGSNLNSPCLCKSGNLYKECHGRGFINRMKQIGIQ